MKARLLLIKSVVKLVVILVVVLGTGALSAGITGAPELTPREPGGKVRPVTTLLISIDGFGHDYLEKFQPPQLLAIAADGLRIKRFLPIYPSKSFPNHLSIITGSYSARHGLVHNKFYSNNKDKFYHKGAAGQDPSWLTALPLWTLAEQQGLHSAVIFWPEAEADIAQILPQDLVPWQRAVGDQFVIDKIVAMIDRPADLRPDLIVGYLSSVDSAGHEFGPDSPQVARTVLKLDRGIARLRAAITKLDRQVNLIIVSDHGMSDLSTARAIVWPQLISPNDQVKVVNGGTQLMITAQHGSDAGAELRRLRAQLVKNAGGRYRVLTDRDLTGLSHVGPNVADIICEVVAPHLFSATTTLGSGRGNHGWDVNNNPEMAGFLVAAGPGFKSGQLMASAENIHLYPLLAALLGLEIKQPIDGKLAVLAPYLSGDSD